MNEKLRDFLVHKVDQEIKSKSLSPFNLHRKPESSGNSHSKFRNIDRMSQPQYGEDVPRW